MSTTVYRLLTLGGRIHYAWVVAIASALISMVGVEPLALFGVYLEPISEGLGVSRGAVSSVYWVAWIALGISSLVSGWATDKVGIRRILLTSTILTVIPLAMLSRATQLWHLYLWYGAVYGFARSGFTTPTLVTITLWFKKKQGLAVGIVSSGLAIGPSFMAPLFRYLIDVYGWGGSFLIMGIGSGIILAPCCWVMRNRPSDLGLRAYGEADEQKATGDDQKVPAGRYKPAFYRGDVSNFFKYAMTTQPFFILPLIHFLGCVSHSVPLAHMVVMATDRGIDPIVASTVLGLATGMSTLSRLAAPVIADRFGGRKALVLFIMMQGISILWLLPARELWAFYLFSVFFGMGYGGEMTPFPVLNRQYYGAAPIGMLYGFQMMAAALGMGLGGFIGGALYDLTGNYTGAIWVAVLAGFAGAVFSYILVEPFKPGMKRLGLPGVKSALTGQVETR